MNKKKRKKYTKNNEYDPRSLDGRNRFLFFEDVCVCVAFGNIIFTVPIYCIIVSLCSDD